MKTRSHRIGTLIDPDDGRTPVYSTCNKNEIGLYTGALKYYTKKNMGWILTLCLFYDAAEIKSRQ